MKLLAIGGPSHGKELPYKDGQSYLYVPIMPDLMKAVYLDHPYCVHGATIASKNDGDRHFVSSRQVADLYGFRQGEWRPAQETMHSHKVDGYCVFPDYWGRYDRRTLPKPPGVYATTTITTATYERRVVSDRVVWVFVG